VEQFRDLNEPFGDDGELDAELDVLEERLDLAHTSRRSRTARILTWSGSQRRRIQCAPSSTRTATNSMSVAHGTGGEGHESIEATAETSRSIL
jgi:hypothetical protein